MLVVSRKEKQRIRVGEDIELVVHKIRGNRVWIGVEAPLSVNVVRDDAKSLALKDRVTPGECGGEPRIS